MDFSLHLGNGRSLWQVMAPAHQFIKSVHGIRYQVRDVARAAEFYTQQLGYPDGNPIELFEPAR